MKNKHPKESKMTISISEFVEEKSWSFLCSECGQIMKTFRDPNKFKNHKCGFCYAEFEVIDFSITSYLEKTNLKNEARNKLRIDQ